MATEDAIGSPTPGDGVVINIGDNPTWPGRFWNGKVDEVRIWNVARTDAEIQSNMSIELTGSEAGLVAYYPMNEGTGIVVEDMSSNSNNGQMINMDNDDWVDGFVPVTADAGVLGIASPSIIGNGFSATEKIKVEIKNYASEPISTIEIGYKIGDDPAVYETLNEEILPFQTLIYTFSQPIDLSAYDEVSITGITNLEGDTNPENDELTETIEPTLNYFVFDQKRHNYGGYGQTQFQTLYMPEDLTAYSEIYLHLDLECPTSGCDPWDQPAKMSILKDEVLYELARYITPYGTACGGWVYDLSDFRSLLVDKVDWVSYIQVWGASGWLLTAQLEFVEGVPEYPYSKVNCLWAEDNWVYGDPDISYDFPEKVISVLENTDAAKVRMTTTGHGQGNTDNAAEFSEFTHHIHIGGEETFAQHLWKDDCDQNSCSPQSGTYLYSRAGWCPGQDVQPWEWDLDGQFTPGSDIAIDYVLADYTNLMNTGYNNNGHTEPHVKCHAYLIQYSDEEYVGINETISKNSNIKSYPNPTSGEFSIVSTSNEKIEQVDLFDLSGKLIQSLTSLNSERVNLDLTPQENGIYFIKVRTASSSSSIKVVKAE